jgi:hypothetical protein
VERLIGQTLGQNKIVEQTGKGDGTRFLFNAYQPGLERYVAILVATQP